MKLKKVFKPKRNPNSNGKSTMSDFDDDRYITPVQFELTSSENRRLIDGYDKVHKTREYYINEKLTEKFNKKHSGTFTNRDSFFKRDVNYVVIQITDELNETGKRSYERIQSEVRRYFINQSSEVLLSLIELGERYKNIMIENFINSIQEESLTGISYPNGMLREEVIRWVDRYIERNSSKDNKEVQ